MRYILPCVCSRFYKLDHFRKWSTRNRGLNSISRTRSIFAIFVCHLKCEHVPIGDDVRYILPCVCSRFYKLDHFRKWSTRNRGLNSISRTRSIFAN